MVFDDVDHERCSQVANTREGSTRKARKQAEQLLGLTPCQLVEPDFSRKDGTDDELCATMRVEQLACLGHVAIDGARGQRQRAGNLLRAEEHTSELQSLMRISYAVFCLKTKHK